MEDYEDEDSSYDEASTYARASADGSEDEGRRRRRRLSDREFKDLKSEYRKKRKEPKKPWGRKERLFVLTAILLTAGTSGILALSARSWKLPRLPRLKVPSISVPFWGEETIIIEGNRLDQEKSEQVQKEFNEKTKDLSGIYGLYVISLSNGFFYGVNDGEVFQAASLIKLPVMAAMYKEAENGNLNLDDKYTLKKSDKVAGSGSLYGKPAGYQVTYRNLVELMGKQSDNTAFNIIRKLLGDEKINDLIRSTGMVDTSLEENETTPRDIGIFFEELMKGNIVSTNTRDKILESLTDTIYEDWLAAGIPEGTRVAHKYGREIHVVNDAGIVFSDNPFVIVIMSKGVVEREADSVFPELSKLVFDMETNQPSN